MDCDMKFAWMLPRVIPKAAPRHIWDRGQAPAFVTVPDNASG